MLLENELFRDMTSGVRCGMFSDSVLCSIVTPGPHWTFCFLKHTAFAKALVTGCLKLVFHDFFK